LRSPSFRLITTWVLSFLAGLAVLVQVAAFVPQAQASTQRGAHAVAVSPGYWLMTGFGSTYAFNAPYLGGQLETITQSPCQSNGGGPAPGPNLPTCVAISATSDGQGYWIGTRGPNATHPVTYGASAIPEGNTGSCEWATGPPVSLHAPSWVSPPLRRGPGSPPQMAGSSPSVALRFMALPGGTPSISLLSAWRQPRTAVGIGWWPIRNRGLFSPGLEQIDDVLQTEGILSAIGAQRIWGRSQS
jgi:hypothetical protein